MIGFLNINKPEGLTSHDCVAQMRRRLGISRIGHSGTLDPMATGVLLLGVNQATRLLPYLPSSKVYKATVKFGQTTTTDDREGEVLQDTPCPSLTLEEVKQHLPQFIGTISQVPPAFSAIKIGGKRSYSLARSAQGVQPPPRQVTIQSLQILDWQVGNYPLLMLEIACSAGTYIRSLARDLGHSLGCGGTLVNLERTWSNGFTIAHSLELERVTPQDLLPCDRGLGHLPAVTLEPGQGKQWQNGQKIKTEERRAVSTQLLRVYAGEVFLGIGRNEGGFLHPQVVLNCSC